uniref:MerR family transcriptional regulator n=1 Tax=Streptomyces sp. SS7 TaxID=3108485 RepID=UPI0040400095
MGGRMKQRKQTRPRQRRQDQDQAQPDTPGELMTPLEVAQYFGVRLRRVRNWERRRYLTPVVRRGERVYMTIEVEHLAAMYGR